jgi:two-component sensor histidine kinase
VTEFVLSPSDDHLLLRELAHRVNNEFTSIINTISRAAARSPNSEVKAALNEATEMLHNYVDVHRALKMPKPDTHVERPNIFTAFAPLCADRSWSRRG